MHNAVNKRMRCSWLLLLVYIPVLLAITLHRHGEVQTADVGYYCADCVHNVRHSGHLVQLQQNAHPCVLCQLQNTPCVAPVLILGMVPVLPYHNVFRTVQGFALYSLCGTTSPRAPPYDA